MTYKNINRFVFIIVSSALFLPISSFSKNQCDSVFLGTKPLMDEIPTNYSELKMAGVKPKISFSKLFRSNAPFYWKYSKTLIAKLISGEIKIEDVSPQFIEKIAHFEGIVMGDAHVGNIHRIPETSNSYKLVTRNIDLDDAGIGSLALDFIHYVISIKTINPEITYNSMLDNYRLGLTGKLIELPKFIKKKTDLTPEEYETLRKEKVSKKTQDDKFITNEDLIAFDPKLAKEDKNSIISKITDVMNLSYKDNFEIMDLAMLPVTSGGSAQKDGTNNDKSGTLRIWALIRINKSNSSGFVVGENHIFEIKPLGTPGIFQYKQSNLSKIENFENNRKFFGYKGSDLAVILINGEPYYFREKKITLFDTPYDQDNTKQEDHLSDLAMWNSNQLGIWHAQNPDVGQNYRDFLNNNENVKMFKKFIKFFNESFIDLMEKEINEKKLAKEQEKKRKSEIEN